MKKIACLAVIVTALISAPAFAGVGGKGLGVSANILTGNNGVLGLLSGRGGLAVNANVVTGKGGILGAVLGRGDQFGGGHSSGCGCGYGYGY